MKTKISMVIIVFVVLGLTQPTPAETLSIYEIQYTTDANGTSPQNGNMVDCIGGIVVYQRPGGRPRLFIQDPNYTDGWGAIQVKGWTREAFDGIAIGDWIYLTNVLVEDYRGTTFLQYQDENDPNFTIISSNNPLPRPLVVTIDEITAPFEDTDAWVIPDHNAEKYESMFIRVNNVYVQGTGYGKAFDNYLLTSNDDPNLGCWASDYINNDKDRDLIYHPLVEIDQNFCGVAGILEQYEGESEGIRYDYYQLLTTIEKDLTIEQIADLDGDCDVDFADFSIFVEHWLEGR